jgi:signal-transduction protein with cAMP-binding, CBS, and nucleotidyltransferase domain
MCQSSYYVLRCVARETKTIELALLILRSTFAQRFDRPAQSPAIQLALRVLLPYVDRAHLLSFWTILANENTLQRINNLEKTYAVIEANAARQRYRKSFPA